MIWNIRQHDLLCDDQVAFRSNSDNADNLVQGYLLSYFIGGSIIRGNKESSAILEIVDLHEEFSLPFALLHDHGKELHLLILRSLQGSVYVCRISSVLSFAKCMNQLLKPIAKVM